MKKNVAVYRKSWGGWPPVSRGFVLLLLFMSSLFAAKLSLVTSSADLGDFARQLGGDFVTVTSFYQGDVDPHAVEPRPSMVASLRQADMVLLVGMDLDLWMNSLLEAAKNPKVLRGGPGYVDASESIAKKEVPTGKIDMSLGDVHAQGNPHYLTDPENARLVLRALASRLSAIDPAHASDYQKNLGAADGRLVEAIAKWKELLKPFAGRPVVTWHPSWGYFADRYGFRVVGTIEPKPGIPPGPAHLKHLIDLMKETQVKVILIEPYFDLAVAEKVARATGSKVLIFPQTVGGLPHTDTYLELVGQNTRRLAETLR